MKSSIKNIHSFQDEILAVRSEDEDSNSDDKSELAVSDIEGQEDDDLPDIRAWGKDRRQYYKTDYVDPDYGGFQGKDAHLAELEEEEARNLQKQLAEQLDDADFSLDLFGKVRYLLREKSIFFLEPINQVYLLAGLSVIFTKTELFL